MQQRRYRVASRFQPNNLPLERIRAVLIGRDFADLVRFVDQETGFLDAFDHVRQVQPRKAVYEPAGAGSDGV